MNELQIIEHNNKRVLLTKRLAEQYETDERIISNNFNRNKDRYIKGKHFYCLESNELKEFKATHQFDELPIKLNKLYLWTEKGALLHAKSLNTDKAWDMYEYLVDSYFKHNVYSNIEVRTEIKSEKLKSLEIKEMNARVRLSNQYLKLSKLNMLSLEAKTVFISKAAEALGGMQIISPVFELNVKKENLKFLNHLFDEINK